MKKILLSMTAAAALFFTACEKEVASPELTTTIESKQEAISNAEIEMLEIEAALAITEGKVNDPNLGSKGKKISIDSLPAVIKTYISTNYVGATIKSAFKDKDGNIVVFIKDKDGKMVALFFDKDVKFVKSSTPKDNNSGGNALDSTIVKTITTYISTNYAGSTVVKIGKSGDNGYTAIIKTADGKVVTLYFDKTGKFIKASTPSTGGGGNTLDSAIVKTIKGYIATTYPGAGITTINKSGDGYVAVIKTTDGKVITLHFDKNGKFVKSSTPPTGGGNSIDTVTVKIIKAYITTNYSGATIGEVKRNKDGTYTVVIKTADGKKTELTFDKDGKFLKEKTSDSNGGGVGIQLPAAATAYLTANYPTGKIILPIVKDKDGNYVVTLLTDKGIVVVYFDKDGKFVKEVK